MTSKQPQVFILDDDNDIRFSISSLIQSANIKSQSFSHPHEFLETYEPSWPGCLISDIRMPTMSGLELQKTLLSKGIELPVILMTAFGDIPMAVEAMKMGAFDFLEKPFRPQYLLDQIQQAISLNDHHRKQKARIDSISQRFCMLTNREREIMQCVVEGKANKVIAMKLFLSQKTIEFHRAHVMTKMKANSIAELVQMNTHLNMTRETPNKLHRMPPFRGFNIPSI